MNCVICQTPMQKQNRCGRCKEATGIAHYCSTKCQRRHWQTHKIICVDIATTPVITVEKSDGTTMVAATQRAIDNAPPGAAILIPHGKYTDEGDGTEALVINKPIKLLGNGQDCTILRCHLRVVGNTASSSSTTTTDQKPLVVVGRLTIEGTGHVNVPAATFHTMTFFAVRIAPLTPFESDAFVIEKFGGPKGLWLIASEIIGGSDGLAILDRDANVILHQSEIALARNRGILANPSFIIVDSSVHSCGGYGIKGRSGWQEVGSNSIQPGPWQREGPSVPLF